MIMVIAIIQSIIIIVATVLFISARIIRERASFTSVVNPAKQLFMIKGEVTLGDLTILIPFWAKQGVIQLHPDGRKLTIIKKRELSIKAQPEEIKLFNTLFMCSDCCTLGIPTDEILKNLGQAKIELIKECEREGQRLFTKASVRGKGQLSFLLFVSICLYLFTILGELRNYSDEMVLFTFIMGTAGICFGLYVIVTRTINRLIKWNSNTTGINMLSILILIMQYVVNIGVTVFVWIYLNEYFIVSLISLIAYILISQFCIFARKRTDNGDYNYLLERKSSEEMLYQQILELAYNTEQSNMIYSSLNTIRLVWDDAERVKIPGNYIPVSYN